MGTLDRLINHQEKKIDNLIKLRRQCVSEEPSDFRAPSLANPVNIDHDIEKAYEELSIYKIRKMMGYC